MNHAAQLRNLACAIHTHTLAHTPFKLVAPFKTLARARVCGKVTCQPQVDASGAYPHPKCSTTGATTATTENRFAFQFAAAFCASSAARQP